MLLKLSTCLRSRSSVLVQLTSLQMVEVRSRCVIRKSTRLSRMMSWLLNGAAIAVYSPPWVNHWAQLEPLTVLEPFGASRRTLLQGIIFEDLLLYFDLHSADASWTHARWSVQVPMQSTSVYTRDRCITGIHGLDEILRGGIPHGSTVLAAGTCGSGTVSYTHLTLPTKA
mgnify:CR=1 FL=1